MEVPSDASGSCHVAAVCFNMSSCTACCPVSVDCASTCCFTSCHASGGCLRISFSTAQYVASNTGSRRVDTPAGPCHRSGSEQGRVRVIDQ